MKPDRKAPIALPDTLSHTTSSFGDPGVYANIQLYNSTSGRIRVLINSGLKIPLTNPDNGFGTGKWDYGIGLSTYGRPGTHTFISAGIMKWWFGSFMELDLKNPLNYSLGLTRSFGQGKWLINGIFNGYTEIIKDYSPPQNLSFGLGVFASDRITLNSTFTLGLSESSADYGFGLGWNINI